MGDTLRINEICSTFRKACEEPFNPGLKAYKESGGKIIGVLYNQIPEELIFAAGMLPVRLRASDNATTELAASRFTQVNCSLVKHFYDAAARGRFDFIDGLVSSNACDHARKLEENWAAKLNPPYAYLLCFPKRQGDDLQTAHLAHEIAKLKASLEEHFGVQIGEDDLRSSIASCNETRRLQMRLYELRATRPNPPITGTQALAVAMAATCMPRAGYNELLRELVALCEDEPGVEGYRARVVVYGGEIDSFDLFEAIESQGALIVGDSIGGFGRRAADMQVAQDDDPIAALAYAYLQVRPSEPRLHGTRAQRWAYLERVASEARADGIVQVHIPVCDLWSYERMMFDVEVANKGLACLDLDTEYVFSTPGQTRTRVQAFVESITEGRA